MRLHKTHKQIIVVRGGFHVPRTYALYITGTSIYTRDVTQFYELSSLPAATAKRSLFTIIVDRPAFVGSP